MHPNAFKRQAVPEEKPRTPWVCHAVLGICVTMFVLEVGLSALQGGDIGRSVILGHRAPFPLYGPAVAEGAWWLIPLSAFEHGGGLHLFFNMSVVVSLGRSYESAIGTWRFGLISVASMLGSSMFQLLLGFEQPALGASGMILGWVGAMLPIATQAHRRDLLTWLFQIVIISFLPFVSWQGHLGGFLAGLPCGLLLRLGPTWFKRFAPVVVVATLAGCWFAVQRGAERAPVDAEARR